MLGDDAIIKLKRSLSDVDDLVPVGEATPPGTPGKKTPKSRTGRAFSWSKLTDSIKATRQRSSRSSRTSIDKRDISSPIADPRSPLCPPAPKLAFESAAPSQPLSIPPTTAQSTPGSRKSTVVYTVIRHSYSASDPTNNSSPPERPRHPLRAPPPIPTAPSFGSIGSSIESPLERILESPFEHDRPIARLRLDSVDKKLSNMEPTRLQPPVMGGTKGRAIQQAKEMETLVAERAKRSGDEPPPYDFYELIGKGAYGRVFKGCV